MRHWVDSGVIVGVVVINAIIGDHSCMAYSGPITPVQILWISMVTAVTLGLALGFEKPEADVMRRPPRPPREPVLSAFMMWRVAFVSALLFAAVEVEKRMIQRGLPA